MNLKLSRAVRLFLLAGVLAVVAVAGVAAADNGAPRHHSHAAAATTGPELYYATLSAGPTATTRASTTELSALGKVSLIDPTTARLAYDRDGYRVFLAKGAAGASPRACAVSFDRGSFASADCRNVTSIEEVNTPTLVYMPFPDHTRLLSFAPNGIATVNVATAKGNVEAPVSNNIAVLDAPAEPTAVTWTGEGQSRTLPLDLTP